MEKLSDYEQGPRTIYGSRSCQSDDEEGSEKNLLSWSHRKDELKKREGDNIVKQRDRSAQSLTPTHAGIPSKT